MTDLKRTHRELFRRLSKARTPLGRAAPRDSSAAFLADVIAGLSGSPPSLPCKYFYDLRGSQLFDQITEQAEYYPSRAETELLVAHAGSIARALGPGVDLVELGSGSSIKTRILLDALPEVRRYVPVDISAEHLSNSAKRLERAYSDLSIVPVVGDYSRDIEGIPALPSTRRVVFFPGSSIGNFAPEEALAFLRRTRKLAGPQGMVLVGIDLPKDRVTLERAYDDAAGVTAAFNLNLLHRMKRELGAKVEVSHFEHAAVWQPESSRIEMRLVATRDTRIALGAHIFDLGAGEYVVTEHCYKHGLEAFRHLSAQAGLIHNGVWLDPQERVSLHWLQVPSIPAVAAVDAPKFFNQGPMTWPRVY